MSMHFYDGITDFIFVEHEPRPSDVIFVPGGSYPDAAIHAAELYRNGMAPLIVPSGKYSITDGQLRMPADDRRLPPIPDQGFRTEAEYLTWVLRNCGVPGDAVLAEQEAEYTYQNAIFSGELLKAKKIPVRRAILSCQAFHARRCLLYYQEQFPDTEFLVCPVVTRNISRENWMETEDGIDTVLGEVERCGTQFHDIMKEYLRNPENNGGN